MLFTVRLATSVMQNVPDQSLMMFHFSSDAGLGGSCLCGKQLTRFWNKATDTLSLSLSLSLSLR